MKRSKKTQQALDALHESAERGNPWAQYQLGAIYATGEFGLPVSLRKAVTWYQKASKRGEPEAQYNLGIMYLHGEGITKNRTRGIHWLKKAANSGSKDAQDLLGHVYEAGLYRIRRNARRAMKWYTLAAAHGNSKAEYSLGLMYLDGKGVPKNRRKGMDLIRKAAQQGYAEARTFLATRRTRGKKG